MVKNIVLLLLSSSLVFAKTDSIAIDSILKPQQGFQFQVYSLSYKNTQAEEELKALTRQALAQSLSDLVKGFVSGEQNFDDFGQTLKKVQSDWHQHLSLIQERLPGNYPIEMMIYLVPQSQNSSPSLAQFQTSEIQTSIGPLPWKELKFEFSSQDIFDERGQLDFSNISESALYQYQNTFHSLAQTLRGYIWDRAQSDMAADDKGFVSALAFHAQLQKNASALQAQVLLNLNSHQQTIKEQAKEVRVRQFKIPGPLAKYKEVPAALLTSKISKNQSHAGVPPVQVRLGAFESLQGWGQFTGTLTLKDQYQGWSAYNVLTEPCRRRQALTPRLEGVFTEQAAELGVISGLVNRVLSGQLVRFHIFGLDLSWNKWGEVQSTATDIRFSTLGIECLRMDKVNQQIGGQIEAKIQTELQKILNPDDMTDDLIDYIDSLWP